jgi:basic amino acid/polyamine antiporter, APA family
MATGELSYARKASGLVRGLSFTDAFGISFVTIQPIWSIWYCILIGTGLFLGANLIITVAICAVTCGIFGPLVWGLLSGSMPRAGGEYIYNSRIIHPIIAMGASFGQVVAVTYWNFVLTTWVASPALSMLAQYMGWDGVNNFVTSEVGLFVIAAVTAICVFLSLVFGMGVFKRIQWPMTAMGLLGPIVLAIAITSASKSSFIAYWNEAAAKYDSLNYNSFVAAAGKAAGSAMPTTWNWADTFGAMAGVFTLFIYAYAMVYVAGEVKRPSRTMLYAQWASMAVPVALALWTFIAFYRLVDFNFFAAAAYNDVSGGIEGYTMPYSSSYFTLSWIASHQSWVVAWAAALAFMFTSFWSSSVNLLIVSRSSFAWGMDRMGPKWFTDIHPRWASPVKLYAFFTIVTIVGTGLYQLVWQSQLGGLTGSGMQMVSTFGITALSAILFAYRKRVRGIWESSPYRGWSIFGVPLITIAGCVYLGFISVLLYFAFIDSRTRDVTGKNLIVFAVVWLAGITWYLVWRSRNLRTGIDVSLTYGELPPE